MDAPAQKRLSLQRPRPGGRLGAFFNARLYGDALGSRIDFAKPPGDPGLYGPESVAWKVHANPASLAVGGIAAVILELAEPRVRHGVWDHSSFRSAPLKRIQRTAAATMITTYAARADALACIDNVNRMHARVRGTSPDGLAYDARDPALLNWVQATAAYGFLNAYQRFIAPGMSSAEQDRYYTELAETGALFGADGAPRSVAEMAAMLEDWAQHLEPHPILEEFLTLIERVSPFGFAGRPGQPLIVQAAIGLLPVGLRKKLRLPDKPLLRALSRPVLRSASLIAAGLPGHAPAQARARMGR